MPTRILSLSLSACALSAVLIHPNVVSACEPDPCQWSDKWENFQPTHEIVATDGVIVFRAHRGSDALTDEEALEAVDVTVTIDDIIQPGTLEKAASDTYVWRPDGAFPANANLGVAVSVDNESLVGDFDDCWYDVEPAGYDITVDDGPMAGETPAVAGSEEYYVRPSSDDLDSLVCCDGAYPYIEWQCIEEVYWNEGFCTPHSGTGYAKGTVTLGLDALDPAFAANLSWVVVHEDGGNTYSVPVGSDSKTIQLPEQFCTHAEVTNLATNDVYELDTICFGEDFELGQVSIDVEDTLAEMCTGGAYTCDVVDEAWDETACEPWFPGGDGDGDGDGGDGDGDGGTGDAGADGDVDIGRGGCNCSTGSASPAGLLPLLLLPLFVRRRS